MCLLFPVVSFSQEVKEISITSLKGFGAFKITLEKVVERMNADTEKDQHFYIAKYDPKGSVTFMYWSERSLLWEIHPSSDYVTEYDWTSVRYPTGVVFLDLKTDVVLTEEEMGFSTYLVTKAWVADKLFDAVVNGDLVTIKR